MDHGVRSATIGELLVQAAEQRPDAVSLVLPPDRLTNAELLHGARVLAAGLYGIGVRPGDHVAILMPNCRQAIETLAAVALLGAVSVPLNTRHRPDDLRRVLEHSGPSAVVTVDGTPEKVDFADLLRESLSAPDDGNFANRPATVLLGGGHIPGFVGEDALRAAADRVGPDPVGRCLAEVSARDTALLLYTSGTTSAPKGCLISHAALVGTGTARITQRRRPGAGPAVWTPCPLFHVGALVPWIGCLGTGAPFVTTRRFDPDESLRLLETERVGTALPLFAAFTESLLEHPRFAATDLSALGQILTTGSRAQVVRAQRAFAPARLVSGYGMTELCGVAASSRLDESDEDRLEWDGTPFPGISLRTVDPESGRALPPGVLGEIVARGYCTFDGYYRDAEATRAAFDADGWFHTGDMGLVDGCGRVAFRGRYKDMLKVGGENVAAAEVEDLVSLHPAVAKVAVVGVPDPRLDEVAAAFVELAPGRLASAVEIIDFCRARAASFKAPRRVAFVRPGEWPMSATKVNKVALRERAAQLFPSTQKTESS